MFLCVYIWGGGFLSSFRYVCSFNRDKDHLRWSGKRSGGRQGNRGHGPGGGEQHPW